MVAPRVRIKLASLKQPQGFKLTKLGRIRGRKRISARAGGSTQGRPKMFSQREPSDFALAMIAAVLDHLSHAEPTDYALATIAVTHDHQVLHPAPENDLVEEKS